MSYAKFSTLGSNNPQQPSVPANARNSTRYNSSMSAYGGNQPPPRPNMSQPNMSQPNMSQPNISQSTPQSQPSLIPHIQDKQDLQNIVSSNQICVIDIYGDWCGPCKMVAPMFEQLAGKYGQHCSFYKEDVDKNISEGVNGVPTFRVYHNGQHIHDTMGGNMKELESKILESMRLSSMQ